MQCVTHLANTTRIQSLQALCCAGLLDDASQCAICPNPDLAGIGVRVAFYLQSLVNALLIAFSPSDSVPTAWAGTLLTLALVIAGFVSKHGNNLTLHHATLILNFTTLSTISSLAVAPMLPIWKLSPEEFYERHRRRHALLYTDKDDPRYIHDASDLKASWEANHRKQRIKKAQRRQREIISVVLLLQVVLQWAWGIFLFVSPTYSQDYLNNSTQLVLFLAPFETGSINKTTDHPHAGGFLIWAAWILFCLSVTMLLVVNLAVSGSSHSQTSLSSVNTGIGTGYTSYTSNTPIGKQWEKLVRESLILRVTRKEVMKGLRMLTMLALWALFIAASEWQRLRNCMFDGEQDFGSLGQITALSVSLAPLWSLIVALNKYPSLRRKRQRLGQSQRRSTHAHRNDDDERAGHDDSDETGRLLRNSLTISPPTGHLLLPSDETLRNSSESFEMSVLRPFQDVIGLDHQPGTSASFPIPHSASTPSRYLSPSMPNPAPELHSHQRSALRTTATPLAAPLSSSESSSISDGTNTGGIGSIGSGQHGLSPGTTSTGLNRRPVQRPHGPRPSISLSPTDLSVWGGQPRDLHSLGSR